jgi:hypothetical protein
MQILKAEELKALTKAFYDKTENPTILHNQLTCDECNTTLISRYQHDYQYCGCGNQTFVDGGHAYFRAGARDLSRVTFERASSEQKHSHIRELVERGGRGKNNNEPLAWVKLKDINDKWLDNLIDYCQDTGQLSNQHFLVYLMEREYRKDNGIIVEE